MRPQIPQSGREVVNGNGRMLYVAALTGNQTSHLGVISTMPYPAELTSCYMDQREMPRQGRGRGAEAQVSQLRGRKWEALLLRSVSLPPRPDPPAGRCHLGQGPGQQLTHSLLALFSLLDSTTFLFLLYSSILCCI